MLFHVRLSEYPVPRQDKAVQDASYQYFDDFADQTIARGPTSNDEGTVKRATILFVDFPDRAAVERFVAEAPGNKAGNYMHAEIDNWRNSLGRRQRDFPRREGQVFWYVRGFAKPDAADRREALIPAHRDYLHAFDHEHLIVRGGSEDDNGRWAGFIMLIALPDRQAADAFVANEPFCKNGLFERLVIERYRPGGRPGQIV